MFDGKPSVYTVGPITGVSFGACVDWRVDFARALAPEIICFSPMRRKDDLQDIGGLIKDDYVGNVLSCSRGIMTRDYFDCRRHDLAVANFLGAQKVSIGSIMEVAWTFKDRVPLIVVMEPEGNVHDYSMVREATGFRVTTLQEAEKVARAILLP